MGWVLVITAGLCLYVVVRWFADRLDDWLGR